MLQDKDIRLRILTILKILQSKTNLNRAMTIKEIIFELEKKHGELFRFDRRAIYRDIDEMMRVGLPVYVRYGKNNCREMWWSND